MLRFRPIAPKPAGGDAISSAAEQERRNGGVVINGKRTKRKYVRVRAPKSRNNKRKIREIGDLSPPPEKSGIEDESPPEKGIVTLQLLPERSESSDDSTAKKTHESWNNTDLSTSLYDDVTHKKLNAGGAGTAPENMLSVSCDNYTSTAKIKSDLENWNNYNSDPYYTLRNDVTHRRSCHGGGMEDFKSVRSVPETRIIVECVTDTYLGAGIGLGFSDREKINSLQADTCPGFVSDGTNNVVWVNQAYRKMVGEGDVGFMVRLVVKEKLPHFCPSFACRVRVVQHRKQGHNWNKIVPCDVWRMEFAGFAWKLDVNTALGLGI